MSINISVCGGKLAVLDLSNGDFGDSTGLGLSMFADLGVCAELGVFSWEASNVWGSITQFSYCPFSGPVYLLVETEAGLDQADIEGQARLAQECLWTLSDRGIPEVASASLWRGFGNPFLSGLVYGMDRMNTRTTRTMRSIDG